MAVRRDKNGKWRYRVQIRSGNGSVRRISGTPIINTKLEAQREERQHIQRLLHATPETEEKEVLSFRDFVEQKWWPIYPKAAGNRPSTVREKEFHLRIHLLPDLGEVKLDQLQGEAIDGFFAELQDKGLSAKSRKNIRATLRRVLASAVEWGYLGSIPSLPKVKVPEPSFDLFTKEESETLLEAARNDEERLLIMFALYTGARAVEQLALEWGDIDWRNNFIVFRRSVTRVIVGHTKSGRERKVPMTQTLRSALKNHQHLRSKLVFCNADGSAMNNSQLWDRLMMVCRRAGLRRIRWHDLRHTFASQLIMEGVPLRQVQAWLGHSTIQMTMRYSHLAPNTGAELISVLDKTWRGKNMATPNK
ncbi:MAG: site-specific integrase [Deltaproteobacteria bacterium]|nr:site-specific integrase [Deltaproteobacteria bacterium]